MMTFQALVGDPGAADDKRQLVQVWLEHYMSEPNAFFFSSRSDAPDSIHSVFSKILTFATPTIYILTATLATCILIYTLTT